ncbi:hypothetical protein QBC37DRAFT_432689 [Rhypophila decipiens]|uniref:Uncharacterized protein n=1 Tax=Rhypophila decipiens TaxID=261697 RepID=A0AAN6XWK7_9PEZI|nr:hypothetical protein QBC37DRAFT_432689 [Rhypophila decipiens]
MPDNNSSCRLLAPQKLSTTFTTSRAFNLNYDPDAPAEDAIVYGFSSKGWETAFVTANATGYANITGYDMSTAYPGSRSPEDWQDSVQARTGVNFTSGPNPGLATGIWLRTHVPANLLQPIKLPNGTTIQTLPQDLAAWQLCPIIWAGPNLRSKTPLAGPGCAGFLSEQCIADWQENLRKTFVSGNQQDDGPKWRRCPTPSLRQMPSSCNETGLFGNFGGFTAKFNEISTTFSDNMTDQSDINQAPLIPTNGTFEMFMFTINKPTTDEKEYTSRMDAELTEAMERVFVMAHMWGTPGKFRPPNETVPSPQATVQLTCLQANGRVLANDDAAGGRDENDDATGGQDENGGSFIQPLGSLWTLVAAATVWEGVLSWL